MLLGTFLCYNPRKNVCFNRLKVSKIENIVYVYKLNIKLCVYPSGGINTRGWLCEGGGDGKVEPPFPVCYIM